MNVVAVAQPNIALIKYWGKADTARNLPAVGSLSLTLDTLQTRMSVALHPEASEDRLTVGGKPRQAMLQRVSACLDAVLGRERPRASVSSESNFPIGAGLASSASAFAALVTAASGAGALGHGRLELARLAGAASGSAARSLYEGIVSLRPSSAPVRDIDVRSIAAPEDWPLSVVVAVTDPGPKPVGSREAMLASAASSPFYENWVKGQEDDLAAARHAIEHRDFEALAEVAEHNCLKMHSLTWTSRPPVVYWNAATLACLETVRGLRRGGEPVFFTIDAGPQVKAICLPEAADKVAAALGAVDGVVDVMRSGLGAGARLLRPK